MKITTLKNPFPVFILFILSVFNTSLFGQDTGIGLKTGIDISTQLNNFHFTSGELELDLNPQFTNGYNLGIIYRNRISRNFRIQAEPTYMEIGARYKESFVFRGFNFETDSDLKLNYLQLPLLLGITTAPPDLEEFPKPWEETTYHAIVGFYGSYLLDATFTGSNSGSPIGIDFEEAFSEDVTSGFNSYDAGLILGGGFEHGYLNKMGMEARLMLGLLNTNNAANSELKANNFAISVTAYYIF